MSREHKEVKIMFPHVQVLRLRVLLVAGLIAVTSTAAMGGGPAFQPANASGLQRVKVAEDYGMLPLSFEANTGQADNRVKFLSRGSGYGLYLTGQEAVLALQKGVCGTPHAAVATRIGSTARQAGFLRGEAACKKDIAVVRMRLVGAGSGAAAPVGEEPLPGTANYFIGNDPANWHTSVPTYSKVRYSGVYPGVDLVYYGNQRQLEYDFVVAPGADTNPIRLQLPGAKQLRLGAAGDLVVTAAGGTLTLRKPDVYQLVDGQRKAVEGSFALLARHSVGFRLGNYDHRQPLVIDPVLVYSTFLGGTGAVLDGADAIVADGAGNAYLTGSASSTNFPVTTGAYQTTNHSSAGCANTFVTKLNPSGTALVYSTYLGGSGCGDYASGVAVDSSGNAYVVGQAHSTDFPVTQGALLTTRPSYQTGFVTKLNPSGNALVYSTYLGGTNGMSGDSAVAVAVDGSGNAYVVGAASSTNFPVTTGAYQTVNNIYDSNGYGNLGGTNAFVAKLNPTGSALVYSTYLGGSGMTWGNGDATEMYGDSASGIAIDGPGDAYIVGGAYSTNFPITTGAYQTHNNAAYYSGYNAFVTKLNSSGTALVYSTYLGGGGGGVFKGGDGAAGVAVDSGGNAYVTGSALSSDFPVTTGAFQTTKHAVQITSTWGSNAFVTKLNPAGSAPIYSTYLGGSNGDGANGLAVDASGNVYVVGYSLSFDFPVTKGAFQPTNHTTVNSTTSSNAFVSELNGTGNTLVYSTYLGGSNVDSASSIALDGSGNAYVAGAAGSSNFPVTTGAFQTTNTAGSCCSSIAFVTKMDLSATTTTPVVTLTPSSSTVTATEPFTVTVSVGGPNGNPTPTGSVTLSSGNYTSALDTLSGGSVVIHIPAESLVVGTNVFTAIFSPDGNSSSYASASGTTSVEVTAATPTITVTPSVSSVTTTQAFSVAIVVNGGSGNPTPTGSVIVTSGAFSSAPTTLSSGGGTIKIYPGSLAVGVDSLNVTYTPDSASVNIYAGASGSGSVTVTAVASATSGWTWMAGNSTMIYSSTTNQWGQSGVYGTQGSGGSGNTPGGRQGPSGWTDSSGHLWVFGGDSFDSLGNVGWINDLWEFNPSTKEWTWMGGSKTSASHGVYGTLGVFAAGNIPGGRWAATTWKDGNGNFWLFGGYGYDVNGSVGYLNDLWEYNPATNQWAWIGGSKTIGNYGGEPGVYGTLQTPAQGNIPGGRKSGSGWTDASGRLWLFGGFGTNVNNGNMVDFNDLWEFTPSTGEWAWMGGSNALGSNCFSYYGETVCGQSGTYGTQGQAALGNTPGGRNGAVTWTDSKGNLWLFGGNGFDILTDNGLLNDLWEFSPSTNEWTWIGGDQGVGRSGVYGSLGSPSAANLPGARTTASSWIDGSGNLWLFGGQGYDITGQEGQLNDLWEFNPNMNEWAWINGSSAVSCGETNFGLQCGQPGIYGTLSITTVGSVPGGRASAAAWSDGSGNFWVFGGEGYDEDANWGWLNDLWRYQPTVSTSPSFSISPSSATVSVVQGSSNTDTISVTDVGGFSGAVTLAASGLPNGVTANLATNPTSGSSVVTFTATNSAIVGGPVTFTITGTSGPIIASTSIALTVTQPPSFTLSPSTSTLSVAQGSGNTDTITVTDVGGFTGGATLAASGLPSGVTAAFATNPTTGSSLLTLTASSTATVAGPVTVTITGTSGTLTASTTIALTVTPPPSFTLSPSVATLSVAQGSSNTDTITVTGANGFTGSVTLAASGLPTGVTASFATNPTTGSSVLTLTSSSTATVGGPVTVTVKGTSGTLTASTTIALTVNQQPAFALAPAAGTLSVTQGSNNTDSITVTPSNGFTGGVTLSASGLPSGVTASFSPNPTTTGSSLLTFTANSTAATGGPVTVTITGTSGTLTETATVALTVNVAPGFTLAPSPGSVTVVQGNSGTSSIALTDVGGFNGAVTFAASGLPTGVTASFSPNPISSGSSALTLTASSTATTGGPVTVTITGTSGTLTASTTIALNVTQPQSFTLSPSTATLSLVQGSSNTDTITVTGANGFTGAVTLALSGLPSGVTAGFATNPTTGSSVLTLTASTTATMGGPVTVTIKGTSGTLTASTTIALTVNPPSSFTLSPSAATLSVVQGSSSTDTITVTGANGFTGSVTLASTGLPSGVTASFATNPTTGSSVLTFTASSTATVGGPATVTITGTSGALTASTTIALTVIPPASFTLSPSAATLSVDQGNSNTDTISVTGANGFTGSVTLSASGLPSGVTVGFATNPTTGSSVLTLTASSTATVGGPVTVTITGTSGSLTASATIAVTVAAPPFTVTPSTTSVSIAPGATTGNTVTITVTPANGFTGTVNLTCSISPLVANGPTCALSPTSVTITGATAQTLTLTVATTAGTSAENRLKKLLWPSAGGTALALVLLIGVPRRRRNWLAMLGLLALFVSFGVMGCGGGGGNSGGGGGGGTTGTTAGTYTITVTGTSGTVTGTLGTVSLTVQ